MKLEFEGKNEEWLSEEEWLSDLLGEEVEKVSDNTEDIDG